MVGHLRNVALLLRAQRSRRHKNYRIGGLMFDSIYLTPNSLLPRDLAKEILHLFKHLSSEIGFYQQTSLLIMHYTDKSANHVLYHIPTQIWQLLQHSMGSQAKPVEGLAFPFRRRWQRSYALFYNVFSDMILYPHIVQQLRVSKTIPALACPVALMIWHSCYRAQTLIYQCDNKFLPLAQED